MRLATIFLIASMLQASATSMAQQVTFKKNRVTLKQLFKEVRKQTGYSVIWGSEEFNANEEVSVNFDRSKLTEVFDIVVAGKGYSYFIDEKTIIIQSENNTIVKPQITTKVKIDVEGKVVDEKGSPLAGASVSIKATGKGVSTKADGKFVLNGVEEGTVIVITFIGFLPKEIVASKNVGTVKLDQSSNPLDVVQVEAYRVNSRRLSTSNITTVKAEEISKQPVNNPLLALQGRVPGLTVVQANGLPGAGVTVRIQGQNSMLGGLDPLYIIDGVPYASQTVKTVGYLSPLGNSRAGEAGDNGGGGNPLSYINPNDIESIDVLKDADATSIYGSRAANGAILITTKRGKAGAARVDFNSQQGFGKVTKRIERLNTSQYITMRREAMKNDNLIPDGNNAYDILNLYGWDTTRTKDWQSEFLGGTSNFSNNSLTTSGGTSLSQYLIGGTYSRETTISPGDFADVKGSAHFNFNTASQDQRLRVSLTGSYMVDVNNLQQLDLAELALGLAPTAPDLYKSDGTLNWGTNISGTSTFNNPLAQLNNTYKNKTSNLVSNAQIIYAIIPKLSFKIQGGYTTTVTNEALISTNDASPPEVRGPNNGFSNFADATISTAIVEPQFTYQTNIGNGKVDVLFGGTYLRTETNGKNVGGYGYVADQMRSDPAGATTFGVVATTQSLYKYTKLFSRVNYNLRDRYIFNLTMSRDGSSRFGPENRFHIFGAIGAGWIFSSEEWIKRNFENILSFGKLKASYGTTGSDQTGDYSFYDLYTRFGTVSYQDIPALSVTKLFNPYLGWEESRKLNLGLDLGFLNDRILLNFNYGRNRSANNLQNLSLPWSSGFASVQTNVNVTIQNSSLEWSLITDNVVTKDFKWSTSLNLTIPKNKLVAFSDLDYVLTSYEVNKPLDFASSKYYRYAGVNPATGAPLFYTNEGGTTTSPRAEDRNYISLNPEWFGGISNNFNYKNFSLSFFVQVVNKKSVGYTGSNGLPGGLLGTNVSPSILENRWQQPGDMASRLRLSTTPSILYNLVNNSDAAIIDGSFIRLKNVSLSWSLPETWKEKLKAKDFKLFTNAQNLLVLSKYQGLDPETAMGIPPLRVIMFGLHVGF